MKKSQARLYNLLSIVFLLLTVGWGTFVAVRLISG
jgi:hypothetical protein